MPAIMDKVFYVVNAIGPIVLVVGLGAALRAIGLLPVASVTQLNRLVYWVALPCLLVHKTAHPVGEGSLRRSPRPSCSR